MPEPGITSMSLWWVVIDVEDTEIFQFYFLFDIIQYDETLNRNPNFITFSGCLSKLGGLYADAYKQHRLIPSNS